MLSAQKDLVILWRGVCKLSSDETVVATLTHHRFGEFLESIRWYARLLDKTERVILPLHDMPQATHCFFGGAEESLRWSEIITLSSGIKIRARISSFSLVEQGGSLDWRATLLIEPHSEGKCGGRPSPSLSS